MRSDVEIAAVGIIQERSGGVCPQRVAEEFAWDIINRDGVCPQRVAEEIARNIINRDTFVHEPDEAIEAGVADAIGEICTADFDAAFDLIQKHVSDAVEEHAKEIALRMLRELAAKAPREEIAAAG